MAVNLSSIWKAIKAFGNVLYKIGAIALPIIKQLRPAVSEIDAICDRVEAALAKGEVGADQFLDRNLQAIKDTSEVLADSIALFHEMRATCDDLVTFSQIETPDAITPQEAAKIGERINTIRILAKRVATKAEPLETKLAAFK